MNESIVAACLAVNCEEARVVGMSRKRKARWKLCVCVLAVLFVVALSAMRIASINSVDYIASFAQGDESIEVAGDDQPSSNEQYRLLEFDLGDETNMEGLNTGSRIFPSGITVSFSNPRFVSCADMMERFDGWIPFYGLVDNEYDDPWYFVVDMTVKNFSGQVSPVMNFTLESGSWSTYLEEATTELFNDYSEEDPYLFMVSPGETKTFSVSYELWEPTFSEGQWQDVLNLDYSITYVDYPTKITVKI